MSLKKAWCTNKSTKKDEPMFMLTLESDDPQDVFRLHAHELTYPKEPTPENPLHHVITIGLLDIYDLRRLRDALDIQVKIVEDQLKGDYYEQRRRRQV